MPSFSKDVSAFAKKAKLYPGVVVRKVSFQIFQYLLLQSPVDTGRFRASWRLTTGKRDLSVAPPGEGQASPVIPFQDVSRGAQTVYITNNLEYGRYLEEGSSQQAPAGWVEKTVILFPTIVEKMASDARKELRL